MSYQIQEFLGRIYAPLKNLAGVPLFIFLIVLSLTLVFLLAYLLLGGRVYFQLRAVVSKLKGLKAKSKKVEPSDVTKILPKTPFQHLWEEYSDTLHELKRAASAEMQLTEIRATVPAELFFTRDVLVDSRLFDEFGRHLPGILTGLGIIGTFAGLLTGLGRFDATTSASAVAGLKPLLDGVADAFMASAMAISCAMLVVFVGRLTLALCYGQVERLNHAIDALYATGAGEEYLSRLVTASERSETHAEQLKDGLVGDLKIMMENLVQRQIDAQSETTDRLGRQLGESFAATLAAPILKITEAIETTTRGNGDAVSGMMEQLMTGFMARLEDTFGSQISGINDQMRQSISAMTTVQTALQQLVSDINTSNHRARTELNATLEDILQRSAESQRVLAETMTVFIAEFRESITNETERTSGTLAAATEATVQRLIAAAERTEATRQIVAEDEKKRNNETFNRTQEVVGSLSGQVETLLEKITEQVAKTQQNIDAVSATSSQAISRMNDGANLIDSAARRFETAGQSVSGVLERSKEISSALATTSTAVQNLSASLRDGFDKYDRARQTVDSTIGHLTSLIETVKKEAGLSKQMLDDLNKIVDELRKASDQSEDYLKKVNGVLTENFNNFGNQMIQQLTRAMSTTDQHLSKGINALNAVVEEFQLAVARLEKS